MTITFGSPWSLAVTFDGKAEFQQKIDGSVSSSSPMVSVGLGVAAFGGTAPLSAHYDNVAIDVR